MANRLDPKEVVPLEETLKLEILINQALIDLLVFKGVFTHEELTGKIQGIRRILLHKHIAAT